MRRTLFENEGRGYPAFVVCVLSVKDDGERALQFVCLWESAAAPRIPTAGGRPEQVGTPRTPPN